MSRLTDRLTSERFKVRYRGQHVMAYVENEEDLPFWKDIFSRYATTLPIKIQTSIRGDSTRGKSILLELTEGPFLLLCMDSDYDYLLQNTTVQSQRINNSDFIFQTYTYSIENYKCYAPSLDTCVYQASFNDNYDVNFTAFLEYYSKIVYPLFLYSFYAEKIENRIFTITDFNNSVQLPLFDIRQNAVTVLQDLETKIQDKIAELQPLFADFDAAILMQELDILVVSPENTYLFVQGHNLMDTVITSMLTKTVSKLKGEKYAQFQREKIDDDDFRRKKSEYDGKICDVKDALQLNTNYHDCFLMHKIKDKLADYLTQHNPI